jgi:alginate O-acetyltransferase complex protein AlgJ
MPSIKSFFKIPGWPLLFNFKKNNGLPLLFILLGFLPLADMIFKISQPLPIGEKRRLAAQPQFSWRKPWDYLKKYEDYFNDHFGFRSQLLYHHNRLTVRLFDTSPTDKVIVGRQGWLFMGRETKTRNELDYFRSLRLFAPEELRHWRNMLRQRRAWLSSRGIFYIFLVVPNKSTIYPEFMPRNIRRLGSFSRLDQLLAALRQEKDFPVLDIRETLWRAKKKFMVYNKTDSHWNELGAYFAFEKIMGKLAEEFPGLEKPSLDQFTIESMNRAGGDLAQMLSLQQNYFREQAVRLRPKKPAAMQISQMKRSLGPYIREITSQCPTGELPTTLMVHDSFVHQLKPLLSPRCRRIIYVWDWGLHFFKDVIEKEKPAIVIEEIAERVLCDLVLQNPPELNGTAVQ